MLAYILAIIIAFTSIILYLSAFFLSRLHRQDDFLWSAIGLFYALVLWVCAERITGGILLGQSAAVILVVSFGWQTVRLRRVIAYPEDPTAITNFSILSWVKSRLGSKKNSNVAHTPSLVVETIKKEKDLLTREVNLPISKEVFTEKDTFPEMAETFIEESAEVIALIGETETLETSSQKTPESLISGEKLPSPPLTEKQTEEPIKTPIVKTESQSSTTIELELKKPKQKGFSLSFLLSSLLRLIRLKSKPSSEIITESSNQQELDIEKEECKNFETLEKQEKFEAISQKKTVIEYEVAEALVEREELATQQVKKENFDFLEQPQATKIIVEGTEMTPETCDIEQPKENTQETSKESILSKEIALERCEETPRIIADD